MVSNQEQETITEGALKLHIWSQLVTICVKMARLTWKCASLLICSTGLGRMENDIKV